MAKKKKDGERASFLFDDDAGRDEETIDLFGSDDDVPAESDEDVPEEPEEAGSDEPDADAEGSAEAPESSAAPQKARAKDKPSDTPQFRFDRYGRRVGKKKKMRYGKRKDAPKARR